MMTTVEFNNQYLQLTPMLHGFAMKLTRNEENAKDLMQETWLRVYAHLPSFTDGTNFKAWATIIMRNCFINDYRKLRLRNTVEQPLEDNLQAAMVKPVLNKAPSIIMQKELGFMLRKLPRYQQLPFELFFQGFSYKEIAGRLAVPIGTVKSRIFFARKKMMEEIKDAYGFEPATA